MKLSRSEYSLLVSLFAVILTAAPDSAVAFVPTCPHGHYQRKEVVNPSTTTTTTLNYIDVDKLEIEGLMDKRSRHSNKNRNKNNKKEKKAAKEGNRISRRLSPVVGKLAAFIVSRLSGILHLRDDRTMETLNAVDTIQVDTEALTQLSLMDNEPSTFEGVVVDSAPLKVNTVKVNGWSLPTLDRTKQEVPADSKPSTEKPTRRGPSIPYFARPVASQSVVKDSTVATLPSSPKESVEQVPTFPVHSVVDNVEEEEAVASRDATLSFPPLLPTTLATMDWSQAQAQVVQVMEVARDACQGPWASLLSTATSAMCESAWTMAREYAATVSKTRRLPVPPAFVPSPPKFPPSANVFDMQSLLLAQQQQQKQEQEENVVASSPKVSPKMVTTSEIDFASIDDVLMQAESALKVVEELAVANSSSSSSPVSSSPSKAVSVPVPAVSTKQDKKETPSSIGTNMDFSVIDDILMQAESALQLAEASCM